MLNHALKIHLEESLENLFNAKTDIASIKSVGGGDINDAYRLIANNKEFFLKVNSSSKYPTMFMAEHRGLELLRNHSDFLIPNVYFNGEHQGFSYLLMEWMDLSSNGDWREFGISLAGLHSHTDQRFGLDHNNYIGSLPQVNTQSTSWSEFYTNQRLLPLFKTAYDLGKFDKVDQQHLMRLICKLDSIYPTEDASLLHGDLWSGNAAFCNDRPSIFDPAVYYGHREMDIAMTLLFGGFPVEMYEAYNEVYPLEKAWRDRIDIGQIYPLLVHVLLFGQSYARQVKGILKRF